MGGFFMRLLRGWKVAVTATIGVCMFAGPVAADTATLPGGTALSVDIASPTEGAIFASGQVPVTGTVALGAALARKDTTVVYAIDTSGSTSNTSGISCDGVVGVDSILKCEKAAVNQVNTQAAAMTSPVADSGVVAFGGTATALDVGPAAGKQLLSAPGPNIANAIAPLTASGGTNFVAGVTAANTILAASTQPAKTLVFLSDGLNTAGGTLPAIRAGTVVRTFAIGGATCGAATGVTLQAIANRGAPGSSCTRVTNLAALDDVIRTQIGSKLWFAGISVDGGAVTQIPSAEITPSPPQDGPVSATFATNVTLEPGPHAICVVALGTDVGGLGGAQDCVNVQVVATVVDCTTNCIATASDRDVSTAAVVARNLPKTVGLRANPGVPSECGGVQCTTGYDVLFDGSATNGKAAIFVHTVAPFAPRLQDAAVFIDGTQVTRSCLSNIIERDEQLPCKIIAPDLQGGIFYFVKFAADPGIRYR
jgi:hypothetical protein